MRILLLLIAGVLSIQNSSGPIGLMKMKPIDPPLAYEESSTGVYNNPQLDGGNIGLEMGDLNHDGFVDIVSIGDHGSPYVGSQQHGIMVWFGNGTGAGWTNFMNGDFGYGGIAIGDVNNDGLMDVGYGMHHDYSSTDFGDQLIEVALGDGTGLNWVPWDDGLAMEGQSWGMFDTDFADVDCDGDLDIVSMSFGSGDGLHAYLNNGDGTWTHSFGIMGGNTDCYCCFGDVNNDGYADIAAGYQNGTVFLGDGTGHFVNADGNLPYPGSYNHYFGVDLADLDDDGGQELSFCTSIGAVQVWDWSPGNRWMSLSDGLPSSGPHDFTQLCDMDGNGKLDLAVFGGNQVKIFSLGAASTWQETASFSLSSTADAESFRTGFDVDFNGRPDIVLVAEEGSWPSDRNYLRFFKESMKARWLEVRLTYPRGSERFYRGSVVFIDWLSEVPRSEGGASSITLQVSTSGASGPWSDIAVDQLNNGRFQWHIPIGLPASNQCLFRAELSTPSGNHVYTMQDSFTLL